MGLLRERLRFLLRARSARASSASPWLYVWFTIATGGVVFSEPAPYDALMIGAVLLLPVVGLTRFDRGLALYLSLWVLIVAGGYIATMQAGDPRRAGDACHASRSISLCPR